MCNSKLRNHLMWSVRTLTRWAKNEDESLSFNHQIYKNWWHYKYISLIHGAEKVQIFVWARCINMCIPYRPALPTGIQIYCIILCKSLALLYCNSDRGQLRVIFSYHIQCGKLYVQQKHSWSDIPRHNSNKHLWVYHVSDISWWIWNVVLDWKTWSHSSSN